MTRRKGPRTVDDVETLVTLAELVDVVYYKVAGERLTTDVEPEGVADEATEPQQSVQIMLRVGAEALETRVLARLVTGDGRYEVDVGARYTLAEPLELSEEAQHDFVTRVGIMAIYPYVREALYSAATKLRLSPPVLGLIQAGKVQLDDHPRHELPAIEVAT